jgi:DNA-3-methyladenine glycosylase II
MPFVIDPPDLRFVEASSFLRALDPDWARAIGEIGACRHESKPHRGLHETLVRAIAYQQLHAKAGDAILSRLKALQKDSAFPSPAMMQRLGEAWRPHRTVAAWYLWRIPPTWG